MNCTGGDQYFRNSLKGQESHPVCFSVSYIKTVLFTASRGLCSDSFTVFLHFVFKVMPWEQSCSFKSWISKCSKIHRHLQHVLKIVIPHQSLGQVYPCKSEVLWSSRSSDNTTSFQPSQERLHLICKLLWDPLGYDCLENSVMSMTAGRFAMQIWGHSFLPVAAYSYAFLFVCWVFLFVFSINSLEKSEALNPMKYICTWWSDPEISSSVYQTEVTEVPASLEITDWLKKCRPNSSVVFRILEHRSLFLLPESARDPSHCLYDTCAVMQAKEDIPWTVSVRVNMHIPLFYACV